MRNQHANASGGKVMVRATAQSGAAFKKPSSGHSDHGQEIPLRMAATSESIVEFLTNHSANDIPADREPIVISANMHLADALKFLADSWIRACPVQSEDKKSFEGTLDLREACPFLIDMYKERKRISGSFKRGTSFDLSPNTTEVNNLVDYIRVSGSKSTVTDLAKKRAFHIIRPTANLIDIAKALSNGSHLVGVTGGPESTGGLSKVITQVQPAAAAARIRKCCICAAKHACRGPCSSSWRRTCRTPPSRSTRSGPPSPRPPPPPRIHGTAPN